MAEIREKITLAADASDMIRRPDDFAIALALPPARRTLFV